MSGGGTKCAVQCMKQRPPPHLAMEQKENMPRPSTNVALGSTFDSIFRAKKSGRNVLEDIQSEEDKEESDREIVNEVVVEENKCVN